VHKVLGSIPSTTKNQSAIGKIKNDVIAMVVEHTCNLSIAEAEARGSRVLGQFGLHSSLYLKKKKKDIYSKKLLYLEIYLL
jgi:hypothetical protein